MAKRASKWLTHVRADNIDLRDRLYQPLVNVAPPLSLAPTYMPTQVLHQGETSACTGYALASYVQHLLARSDRPDQRPVSQRMLYSMARRYDEFYGWKADEGSSLRGAMKGWFRHGACAYALWDDSVATGELPPASSDPKLDWWTDAVTRPLGAYFRVDTRAIADMHAALVEVGAIYVSALCHIGWDEGDDQTKPRAKKRGGKPTTPALEDIWTIPLQKTVATDGGHAFLIVGYDAKGFIILNSWGETWGSHGYARLSYEDWTRNAMDAWVAQLGVVTEQRVEVANAGTLRVAPRGRQVQVAAEAVLRDHELSPFIIDVGNNGELSQRGKFRTQPEDISFLLSHHLQAFRHVHGLRASQPTDVAIYAHGGLVSERSASDIAARWIPALYEKRIFPVFVMWETGPLEILPNIWDDFWRGEPRTSARVGGIRDWIAERLEHFARKPGTVIWEQMKDNAGKLSHQPSGVPASRISALRYLFENLGGGTCLEPNSVRLHLIGHSAGSIVHRHLIDYVLAKGWTIASCNFMAPADRCDGFERSVLPHIGKRIGHYTQLHLTDAVELRDCVGPYGKSLLYLVSHAFEREPVARVLGMEKHVSPRLRALARAGTATLLASPCEASNAITHAAFDDDRASQATVIAAIHAASRAVHADARSTRRAAGRARQRKRSGARRR